MNRKRRKTLSEEGVRVFLVNARHTKNLPWRKTDVQECQWLLQLHSFGLLNNSFRPAGGDLRAASILAATSRTWPPPARAFR